MKNVYSRSEKNEYHLWSTFLLIYTVLRRYYLVLEGIFVEFENFTLQMKNLPNNWKVKQGRDNFWDIITLGWNLYVIKSSGFGNSLWTKQDIGIQRSLKLATNITVCRSSGYCATTNVNFPMVATRYRCTVAPTTSSCRYLIRDIPITSCLSSSGRFPAVEGLRNLRSSTARVVSLCG